MTSHEHDDVIAIYTTQYLCNSIYLVVSVYIYIVLSLALRGL